MSLETLDNPIAIARACYQAFLDKDRDAIEALLADDFQFTSPREGRMSRSAYFARCWPSSETVAGFDFLHFSRDGERVTVSYVGRSTVGSRFRNTEVITIRDGRIAKIEAQAPWSIPTEDAKGRRAPYKRRPAIPAASRGAPAL